jgi:hypothetical protein
MPGSEVDHAVILTLRFSFQTEHSWLMDKALEKFRGTCLVGKSAPTHFRAQLALATLIDKGPRPGADLISACLQAGGEFVFRGTARLDTEAERSVTVLFPTALQAFKSLQYEDSRRSSDTEFRSHAVSERRALSGHWGVRRSMADALISGG